MPVQLWNTLTRRLEPVTPSPTGEVRLYTCGPTVYNRVHIGNLRAFVFFDVLKRTLEFRGYRVKHVMNITDVDDKIIKKSQESGKPAREITDHYLKLFLDDMGALAIKRPTIMPRATDRDAIEKMVELVERLLAKGIAYKAEDGSIYYKISAFADYGKLAHLDREGLRVGARIAADEYDKENPQDFALWKAWIPDDGDVFWETRLGKGRPGWHLECSALAGHHLGETIDIHAGGVDLIFPHHENEIAQSEAATGKPFSKVWVHNEHLMISGKKMSKRLNNFYTLADLATQARATPREVRYALLSVHYRMPLNFQVTYDPAGKPERFDSIEASRNALERLDNFRRSLKTRAGRPASASAERLLEDVRERFGAALESDLNVAEALAQVFRLVNELNKEDFDASFASKVEALLAGLDQVLGIFEGHEVAQALEPELEALVKSREEARRRATEAKTRGDKPAMKAAFQESDRLRDELKRRGLELEDRPDGTTGWKRVSRL
jgi:cysteinyl-tRNA synthetase